MTAQPLWGAISPGNTALIKPPNFFKYRIIEVIDSFLSPSKNYASVDLMHHKSFRSLLRDRIVNNILSLSLVKKWI